MKKIGYDNIQVEKLQIVEDSRCCLKVNAVINKEGVYPYPDGRAFKSRMELLKATHTARNAKITILDHPNSLVVMSQNQIHGVVEKPFFDRDRMRATLNFDKSTCPPDFLDKVRRSELKDVSIGFYYQPDRTPGKWNGSDYDYVMRDIVIDHVAAGVLKGRCSFPNCGIGVDTMMRRISFQEDKVVKRGEKWCVIHCHGEEEGDVIKCFDTKEEAEAMHRAIQANASEKTDQEKPPKEWMDHCKTVVSANMPEYSEEQVNAVCGNIWHHHPEQHGIGDVAVDVLRELIKKGGKTKKMSKPQPKEYETFIKDYMAQNHTREQAEEHWRSITGAQAVPEEKTPLQQCIDAQLAAGKTRTYSNGEVCSGANGKGQER